MEMNFFPTPTGADRARLLLEYIQYGIIMMKAQKHPDHLEFFVKSPERLHLRDHRGNLQGSPRQYLIQFKRRLEEIEKDLGVPVVLKRAPYKNEFDDWTDDYADQAFEEYKQWLMYVYNEEELMF